MARESNNETQTDLGDKTTQLKNGNATGDTPQPFSEGELNMQSSLRRQKIQRQASVVRQSKTAKSPH